MKEEFIFNTLCKFYTSSKFELKKISVEKDCSYSCYEYLEDNFYNSVYFKYCFCLNHPNLPFFEKNVFTDDFKCSLYRSISGEILSKRLRRDKHLSVSQSINIISGIVNALKYIQNFNNDLVYLNLNIDSVFIEQSNGYEKSILISLENIVDKNDYQFDEKDFSEVNFIYTHPNIINGNIGVTYTIYSLCSILYELLFGITPFNKYKFNKNLSIYGNFSELQKFLSHAVVDFFYQSEDLIKILSKGLMLYPKNYYRSYDDFLTDIHSLSETKEEFDSCQEVKHQLDYVKSNNVGLDSIVGFNDLKEQLKSDIIDVIRDSENARRFGINMPNGILFYGPPGCGKTFFAEKLAEETGFYFKYIRCSDIACPYIHGGQTKIAEIFETAKNIRNQFFSLMKLMQ